jgi:hypothetical protein
MKKLLITGIGCVALKYLVQALEPFGYQPVLLARRNSFPEQIQGYLDNLEIHDVGSTAIPQVIDYIRVHPNAFDGIVAVTTLFDEQFTLVEALAEEFEWASPGPVLAWLSHKHSVLSLIPEYSPPSLSFKSRELRSVNLRQVDNWGPRLVLKPACSSGGLGLLHLPISGTLKADLAAHLHPSGYGCDTEWVLQQEMRGRLLSFEGFVEAGWVRRLGISSRSRIGFTEVASKYPADDHLSQAIIARGWDCVEALVSRAHYQFGYFHCEFIQTATSVYLVDANMGRIGGATVLEQVALAHSINPRQLLAHVLLLPVLRANCPLSLCASARLAPQATLGIWYGLPEAATLEHLHLPDTRGQHTQFAVEGSQVPKVGTSDYAWVGLLCGREEDVLSDIHGITVRTDKGTLAPAFTLD